MIVSSRRLRVAVAAALAAGLALGTVACSRKNDTGGGSGGPVTVTLQYFGSPGFDQAVKDFEASHPDIKVVVQNKGQLKDFAPQLAQYLAAGSGAGDVVMLEEGIIGGYLVDHKGFANLLDLGAGNLKDKYLPYKWQGAMTPDGKKLIGLGTDIGGLALCYRRDLFGKAGLPTERDQVSALWKNWDDYEAVGRQFAARNTGARWLDSATSLVQPYVMQNADHWFFDTSNNYVADRNPVVKDAWDRGLRMAAEGLTDKQVRWSDSWTAAFKNAAFATVPCPSWMAGVIAQNAGDAGKGQWDIATIPGNGGNWGGSFLAIPEQSKHKPQAYQLLTYLTGKEGELAEYKAVNAMPSNLDAINDPAFANSTNAYFNNAPTGKIFGDEVKSAKPIYLGPKHQALWETIFEPAMQAAEQGKLSSDAAWAKAVADGKKLVEG